MVPEGWQQVGLDDLCEKITKGTTPPKSEIVTCPDIPFLRVNNLTVGGAKGIMGDLIYVSRSAHQKQLARSIAYPQDTLMNIVGPPLGKVTYLTDEYPEYNLNQAVLIFRPNQKLLEPDYLFMFVCSYGAQQWLEARSKKTSGQQNLTIQLGKELPILLPPLPEQRKIADILSTWDQAIEKTEALLTNARTQKRALMQQLLTGKRRFPEFEGQPWTSGKLVDHFDFINGRAFKPDDWGEVGFPIIRIQNLTGSTDAINHFDGEVDEKHTVRRGDFLLSWSATLDTFIWGGPVAVLNQHIFKVVPKSDTLKMFGFHLITHEIGKLVSKVHGTSMKHITKKDLAKIESFFPSLAEQEKITEALDDAEQFVNDMLADLTKLRTEKKALMQQLLTGKRRVTI